MDIDEISYLDAALALIFVLLLIMVLGWLLHRLSDGSTGVSKLSRKKRRLAVIETINVGPKSRVIILRRDNKEYLVLIGENKSLLLDGNIDINQQFITQQYSNKIEPKLNNENTYEASKTENIDQKKKYLKSYKQKSPGVFSSLFNKTKPSIRNEIPEISSSNNDYADDIDSENEKQENEDSRKYQSPTLSIPKPDNRNMFERIDKHKITRKKLLDDMEINHENNDNNSPSSQLSDKDDEFGQKA